MKKRVQSIHKIFPHLKVRSFDTGIIRCCIDSKDYIAAQEQLEIFKEISHNVGESATISYLNAVLWRDHHKSKDKAIHYLKEAIGLLLKSTQSAIMSTSFYNTFNPDLIMDSIRDYLEIYNTTEGFSHFNKTARMLPQSQLKLFWNY